MISKNQKNLHSSRSQLMGKSRHADGAMPIFIHSSFRTSSTWVWGKFRPLPDVIAYYEVFNDSLIDIDARSLALNSSSSWESSHPSQAPYFLEYLPLLKPEGGVIGFDKKMPFARFIPDSGIEGKLSSAEKEYLSILIDEAHRKNKQPVLTCTRSLGRIAAIKREMSVVNVVVYRNLFHQWASYSGQFLRGNRYFIDTISMTLENCKHDPLLSNIGDFFSEESRSPYSETTFIAFLLLHIYLYANSIDHSDVVIDATALAKDPDLRIQIQAKLSEIVNSPINLSDVESSFDLSVVSIRDPRQFLDTVEQFTKLIGSSCRTERARNFAYKLKNEALAEWELADRYTRNCLRWYGVETHRLKHEIEDKAAALAEQEKRTANHVDELDENSASLAATRAEREAAEGVIRRLQGELDENSASLAATRAEREAAEGVIHRLQGELDENSVKLTKAETALEAAEKAVSLLEMEKRELVKRVEQKEVMLTDFSERYQVLSSDHELIVSEHHVAVKKIQENSRRLEEAIGSGSGKGAAQSVSEHIDAFVEDVKELIIRYNTQRLDMSEIESQLGHYKARAALYNEMRISSAESRYASERQITGMQARMRDLESDNVALKVNTGVFKLSVYTRRKEQEKVLRDVHNVLSLASSSLVFSGSQLSASKKRRVTKKTKLRKYILNLPLLYSKSSGVVVRSGLLDENWYLSRYPDLSSGLVDPVAHFLEHGYREGRSPHPTFQPDWYVASNPGVATSGLSPLEHYITRGEAEGLRPNILFDPAWYRKTYADVRAKGMLALGHYVRHGESEGRKPGPYFDPAWYLLTNPTASISGVGALAHFLEVGRFKNLSPCALFEPEWYSRVYGITGDSAELFEHYINVGESEGLKPNPCFDPCWYRTKHAQMEDAGLPPLQHYLEIGEAAGLAPGPDFDPVAYLASRPNLANGQSPLAHFLNEKRVAGAFIPTDGSIEKPSQRAASPAGDLVDETWYLTDNIDLSFSVINGRDHFLNYGLKEGRSPHPTFRPDWYLATYPQVVSARLNAIEHYVKRGDSEGLSPNLLFDPNWYRNAYPDIRHRSMLALAHYLRHGESEGRKPGPYFDPLWYLSANPTASISGIGALAHFFVLGRFQGASPCALFEPQWYGRVYGISGDSAELFEHYIRTGEAEGYKPNPYFDPGWYRIKYPQVEASGLTPLRHYIEIGEAEGLLPIAEFDPAAYRASKPTMAIGQSPLGHFLNERRSFFLSEKNTNPDETSPKLQVPFVDGDRRVLIVDSVYPTPDRDSGSVDAINFVRILTSIGYQVYFCATSDFVSQELNPIATVARSNLEVYGAVILDDNYAENIHELIRRNGKLFELFFLSRVHAGGLFIESIRTHAPDAAIIFNTVDLHYIREKREGELAHDSKTILESYRTRERELHLVRHADATLVVSASEVELLADQAPGCPVYEIPLIREVPGTQVGYAERSGIGFIGGYRHSPNIDAAIFFLDEIWPLVRLEIPTISFHLMGADMPPELSSRTDPGLIIVGHVDSLTVAFSKLRLTVAPLRYGAGAKGKVVSSLSHGVPCVCSPIAAEGMRLDEEGGVLVGESPEEIAAQIVRAYRSKALWKRLSAGAIRAMKFRHSLETGTQNLMGVLQNIDKLQIPGR